MAEALRLVLDYFSQPRDAFIRRYFAGREKVLTLATSEESRRTIVEPLNPIQKRVVTDDQDRNRLILAGPGAGKTRVIAHRIAYLLRVRRAPAASVVALAFNRHAANEIRSCLIQLVGADAFGVSILTYHRMAMRLTGTRFDRREQVDDRMLAEVMATAVDLLEGNGRIREEEDDLRARLLRGYRYILVDEYQDIDQLQYRLVSALAGRHAEEDGRLCILAVGDDDQNIYAWRDTSNLYIERFQEDYAAETDYLIDNYCSTRAIVAAANCVIAKNPERMKQEYPIQVDRNRRREPDGGRWEALDLDRRGKVLRLIVDAANDREHGNLQAQACIADLQRRLKLTYVFISHDLAVVESLCDRVAVMYLGRIVEQAGRAELYGAPRHPYTRVLLSSVPIPGEQARRRIRVEGDLPNPAAPPPGCNFAPRCYRAQPRCHEKVPPLKLLAESGHLAACFYADDSEPSEQDWIAD